MARIIEDKIYTLYFDDEEVNNINSGKPFDIDFNGNKVTVKRSGVE